MIRTLFLALILLLGHHLSLIGTLREEELINEGREALGSGVKGMIERTWG